MPETFPGVESHYRGHHFAVLDAGAQALAWTPNNQLPVLWTSPLATFEPGRPVRGGVPIVFPWFGAGPDGDRKPSHGFARTAAWQRAAVDDHLSNDGGVAIRHTLRGVTDATDEPGEISSDQPFLAESLAWFSPEEFRVSLTITNTGTADFRYEAALHSYFAVSDVTSITIEGLDGAIYHDKVTGSEQLQAGGVRFDGETDRIYQHSGEATIEDPTWGRRVVVAKADSANTVIWNPGQANGKALADVAGYWSDFVCIEAGNIGDHAITLVPGGSHTLAQFVRLG